MALSVTDFIDISISTEIEAVQRTTFGELCFIGTTDDGSGNPKSGEKVKRYADLSAVGQDFDDTDPEYLAAELYFAQEVSPDHIFIGFKEAAQSYPDAFDAIREIDDRWYAVAIESRDSSEIETFAGHVQDFDKLYLAATADSDVPDSGVSLDVASVLLDLSLSRTALFYHSSAGDPLFVEAAFAGKNLPQDPGTTTWAWKNLSDVSTDDITVSQKDALQDKRATFYAEVGGQGVTFEGQVSKANEFIDMIRLSDWLKFRIAEDLVAHLESEGKIPYVGGGPIIESIIRNRIDDGIARGAIAADPRPTVTVPSALDQDSTDRANRIFADVTFTAQETGAVHSVEIRGTLVV